MENCGSYIQKPFAVQSCIILASWLRQHLLSLYSYLLCPTSSCFLLHYPKLLSLLILYNCVQILCYLRDCHVTCSHSEHQPKRNLVKLLDLTNVIFFNASWNYLLETDIQVKCERLSGIADRRDGVLQVWAGCTGDELHCVHTRVVTHLRGGIKFRRPSEKTLRNYNEVKKTKQCLLTAKSEVNVHCWIGWL